MFAMRNRPNYWANNYGNNKSKNLGSQSDASSAAFLLLSNGRFRSELPSFFINPSKFFKMRNRKSEWIVPEVEISYKPTKHSVRVTGSLTANKIFRQIWNRQLQHVQEQFYVLFLNQANDVLCWRLMNTGTHNRCIVDHKLLVAIVCKTLTQNIIIAHNHPSGSLQPSKADKQLTWKMQEILKPFDVHVLDHLIINGNDYFSFADEDLIANT
ncbi:DNA repair protein RadC [Elizabethkingia meningoseptica]|nr:DNA repair protein RadC [Elizabethkingia meningoseptica]EOR29093.1 DNA repair protein RadC [Elizabethkingia meningoseptica ATCC 13253 = NBRC 12535]MDE5489323.1 JAB domain-containing protein [Elizabethkingia meningoseptica]